MAVTIGDALRTLGVVEAEVVTKPYPSQFRSTNTCQGF